jgi:hypothetical protein
MVTEVPGTSVSSIIPEDRSHNISCMFMICMQWFLSCRHQTKAKENVFHSHNVVLLHSTKVNTPGRQLTTSFRSDW